MFALMMTFSLQLISFFGNIVDIDKSFSWRNFVLVLHNLVSYIIVWFVHCLQIVYICSTEIYLCTY